MNKYLCIINGEQYGPLEKDKLIAAGVKAETPVWCEGMTRWTPACMVDELSSLFGSVPPPIPPYERVKPAKPKSYLIWAILTTFLCCLPLGVVAIVYSANVDNRYDEKDYEGAIQASRKAKKWAIGSAIAAAALWTIYIVVLLILAAFTDI